MEHLLLPLAGSLLGLVTSAGNALVRDKVEKRAPAMVKIQLPADARLFVDGKRVRGREAERVFLTKPLPPGKPVTISVRVEAVRDGQAIAVTRAIVVRAGQRLVVDFRAAIDKH